MNKRSITLAGHRTSVSLEEPFWQALLEIAADTDRSLAEVVVTVDRDRGKATGLSSALRVFVLAWYRNNSRLRGAGG